MLVLIGCIALAYVWSSPGTYDGVFSLNQIGNYGISFIFFFYGLRLSLSKLREGLVNWRLHTVVQLSTFVLFPLIALLLMFVFRASFGSLLWLGFFFLAALPSTVSSSVVMVSMAKGNLPAAIFNASISSIVGVFITPLWMGLVLSTVNEGFDLAPIIVKLVLQVLLPVGLGVLLNRKFGWVSERYASTLRYFDQAVILLIIYTSFCESFAVNLFSGFSGWHILLLAFAMAAFFFAVYGAIYAICRWLRFNGEDRITALFCGSKKSLVHGTVMSKVLFTGASSTGIILLPIMLYHAIQLAIVSVIARKMGEDRDLPPAS